MPKVHEGSAGDSWDVDSGGVIEVKSGARINLNTGAKMQQAGASLPSSISFAPAANGANVCEVTITVKDGAGVAIPETFNFDVWLSDAATGAGLTAVTASGTVAAKASSGTDLVTLVTKKALRVQTAANGIYVLSITDAAKTGFYVCAQGPWTGRTNVGTQLVSGNYG